MLKHKITPNQQEQQIIQNLMNTQQKGKQFFQLYSNQSLKHVAINAFSLLEYGQMVKVTQSLSEYQINNKFSDQEVEMLNQCYRECQHIQSSVWSVSNGKSQRKTNSFCMLICVGIFISSVFSLWQVLFITSSTDFIENDSFGPVSTRNQTSLTIQQKEIDLVYLTEMIVFYGVKIVSGFWAFFGCLFSTFCLWGCVPNYFQSIITEKKLQRTFQERIQMNRKSQKREMKKQE